MRDLTELLKRLREGVPTDLSPEDWRGAVKRIVRQWRREADNGYDA